MGTETIETALVSSQARVAELKWALTKFSNAVDVFSARLLKEKGLMITEELAQVSEDVARAALARSDDTALREFGRRFGRDLVQKLFGFESTESLDIVDKALDAMLRGGLQKEGSAKELKLVFSRMVKLLQEAGDASMGGMHMNWREQKNQVLRDAEPFLKQG